VIADRLAAAYDADETADPQSRWRSFAIAALTLVLDTGGLVGNSRNLVADGLRLWQEGRSEKNRLEEMRVMIWDLLESKHGNSWAVVDAEDRALRAALFALQPSGDQDEMLEGAGWIEDFLTGAVE
jgi:hypothetical protein